MTPDPTSAKARADMDPRERAKAHAASIAHPELRSMVNMSRGELMGILEGVYLVGHNDAIEDVEAYLIDYRRAYAEDLFTPVKLAEYRGNKREENLVTRTSAHMGRFILDNAVRYIRQLAEEDET